MKRANNDRKYNGTSSHRPDNLKFRREEAKERQAAYDKLAPSTKLMLLDSRLGAGVGAKKQRAKLNALLEGKKDQ